MDMSLLAAVSCLRDLSEAELQLFAELLETREAEPQSRIVEEGAPIEAFYIVASGTVHVRKMAQEREVLLGRIAAGGFFGEINLFDPGVATASIYAVDHVELRMISYEKMQAFMATTPFAGYKITSAMMTELSRRLRQTNDRLVNTLFWTSLSATPPASDADATPS